MFTWICPQCGAEVPPSDNECPRCADRAKAQAAQAAAPPPQPMQHPATPPPPAAPPSPAAPVGAVPQYATSYPVAAQAPPYPYPQRKPGPPGWLVTLGVAAIVSLIGGGFYYYVNSRNNQYVPPAEKGIAFEKPGEAAAPGSSAASPAAGPNRAKFLEASGIRIFEEDKRPRVRLMLINHASADFADVNGSIVILSKDNKEIGTLPIALPQLRAYDAREMDGPLKTSLRAYEMPDWQFMHAEVRLKE
jgi:hypothetical protein